MCRVVAYYRVSTAEQGRSGLGLEAQRQAILSLCQGRGWDVVAEYTRRNLAPRLEWLFDNGRLPADLRDLSAAVKDDGNDGAHDGNLSEEDAEDIYDFAYALLERIYTEPARLKARAARAAARRNRPTAD